MRVGAPAPPRRSFVAIGVVLLVVVLVALTARVTPAAAQPSEESTAPSQEPSQDATEEDAEQAAVSVELTHVVDDAGVGDLETDPDTGLPRLSLNPDVPQATAVLQVTVRNDGQVPLEDLTAVDDLFGSAAVAALAPGEQATVAITRTVTLDEVASGLSGLVEHRTEVVGVAPEGDAVADSAAGLVVVQGVLSTPALGLEVVAPDGGEVAWTGPEAAAGETRTVQVEATVRNDGGADLTGVTVRGAVAEADVTEPAPFDLPMAATRTVVLEVVLTPDVVAVDEPLRDGVELREDLLVELVAAGTAVDGTSVRTTAELTVTAVLGEPVPVRDRAVDQDVVDPEPELPAAGSGTAPVALAALLALLVGTLALGSAAARERREQDDLGAVVER